MFNSIKRLKDQESISDAGTFKEAAKEYETTLGKIEAKHPEIVNLRATREARL